MSKELGRYCCFLGGRSCTLPKMQNDFRPQIFCFFFIAIRCTLGKMWWNIELKEQCFFWAESGLSEHLGWSWTTTGGRAQHLTRSMRGWFLLDNKEACLMISLGFPVKGSHWLALCVRRHIKWDIRAVWIMEALVRLCDWLCRLFLMLHAALFTARQGYAQHDPERGIVSFLILFLSLMMALSRPK